MTAVQNLSILINQTSFVGMVQAQNTYILGGALGIVFYIMIISVLGISLKLNGNSSGSTFMTVAFVGFVLSLILRAMNLIPDWFLWINIALIATSGVIAVFNKA